MVLPEAEHYLIRGELFLLRREGEEGISLFEKAAELDPLNASLYFRQGLSLFEYANEINLEKAYFLAIRKLKKAVALNPHSIESFHVLGNALFQVGKKINNTAHIYEAERSYQRALALVKNQKYDALLDLHWDLAKSWFAIYGKSNEICDLHNSLSSFQTASNSEQQFSAEFWLDFGKANLEYATKMHDFRHCVKAINCFKHATAIENPCLEGYSSLAKTFKTLYETTHEEDHFSQAVDYFESSFQINSQDEDLWIEFLELLCHSSRRNRDAKRARTCIEKCHKALAYHPNQPLILAIWAEALSILGEISDRVDLIFEAQNKLTEALNITEDDPDIWYYCGMNLKSLAAYYHDHDYHYQAIQKFQIGVSIDRSCHHIWHALAQSYSMIAQFTLDPKEIEKTLKFYQKALSLSSSSFYLIDYAHSLSKLGELTHNKNYLENALQCFEYALNIQKNAIYLHPDWLFYYGSTLDLLGDFHEEDHYYNRAIEIFSHVLMIDPDYPGLHHRLAQTFCHMGDLIGEDDYFYRAVHHLRLALKQDDENDMVILDWGLALINIAQHAHHLHDAELIYKEAEHKIMQAAKLGNLSAYYHLGCLYSIQREYDKAMYFIHKADQFKSLPSMDEILQDEWLDGLRSTDDFREFISHLEKSS